MSYAATVVLIALALMGALGAYLYGTRTLAAEVPAEEKVVVGDFVWETTTSTPPGDYLVDFEATDEQGSIVTKQVKITVLPADPPAGGQPVPQPAPDNSSSSSDGGGGGSGDSDGGGGGEEQRPQPRILGTSTASLTFQAETGHTISGSYSGVEPSKKTVVLAHPRAVLERSVNVSKKNYWLEVQAKHDRPGPVMMAVYLNNRAWKVVTLNKNDNKYRTLRVGLLRNFGGGKIRFRLINDHYDKKDPTNGEKDRNLHIDWWRLIPE